MRIINVLYTLYAGIVFLLMSLVFVPVMVTLCHSKTLHQLALRLHIAWANVLFFLVFIPVKIEWHYRPDKDKQYIFCANHFSYLDIPAFFLLFPSKFIGKSSLGRIPLFGYFFRHIHIPVNRSSVRSRAESLRKAKQAVDDGFSITFFPEGGVWAKPEDLPYMVPFHDGAFRLSVEKQLPIVPVTMPFNYRILPDQTPLILHRHPCQLVVHPPVFPQGHSEAEIKRLKAEVFEIIQKELMAQHSEKVDRVS